MAQLNLEYQANFEGKGFGDPGICARCSQIGPTCCQCRRGEEELAAMVSERELNQMVVFAPWTADQNFVVRVSNSPAFIRHIKRLFPDRVEDVSRVIPPDGWHYRLFIERSGQCSLLGPSGCLLPRHARPLFCRVFPFWFIGNQLQVFLCDYCLAVQGDRAAPDLFSAMGTTPDHLYQLFDELCHAWGFSR